LTCPSAFDADSFPQLAQNPAPIAVSMTIGKAKGSRPRRTLNEPLDFFCSMSGMR
jgi:hypothetical protein